MSFTENRKQNVLDFVHKNKSLNSACSRYQSSTIDYPSPVNRSIAVSVLFIVYILGFRSLFIKENFEYKG